MMEPAGLEIEIASRDGPPPSSPDAGDYDLGIWGYAYSHHRSGR